MDKAGKQESHIVLLALLLAGICLVYAQNLSHEFLLNWDDMEYVVENETIRGFEWKHIKDAFTSFYMHNYAPLHLISYMLDYAVWGLNPAGFLLANVVLHALNGFLFYFLIVRLSGRRLWGFLAAFLFLFHPVQVESVAWISQRKNLLAMAFFLLAFHSYISYKKGEPGRRRLFYALSILASILALMSKSVTMILPLALVLFDLCYPEKQNRRWMPADKLPYVLVSAAAAFLATQSQSPELGGGRTPYLGGSPVTTFFTMVTVLPRYLGLFFWPVNLSALYMPPIRIHFDAAIGWSVLLLVLLSVLGIFLFRRRAALFFWFALFFVGLMPVSQDVPLVTFMNDRYLYFPMLGAAALFGGAAVLALGRTRGYQQKALGAALCLLLLPLPLLSWQRSSVWKNDLTLWGDTAGKTPDSPDAWFGLGMSYSDAGMKEEEVFAYMQALSIDPDYWYALGNLGGIAGLTRSRPLLIRAVADKPEYFDGYMHLGTNYYLTGEFRDAALAFGTALTLRPNSAKALFALGNVHYRMRDLSAARKFYEQAAGAGGINANLEYHRACVEALDGRAGDALRHLEDSFKLGYKDYKNVSSNPDLNSLRQLQDFQRLVNTFFGTGRNS